MYKIQGSLSRKPELCRKITAVYVPFSVAFTLREKSTLPTLFSSQFTARSSKTRDKHS